MFGDLFDGLLWHPPQAGIQLQVLQARQQVADGIKLWTVAHHLVDSLHLSLHAEKHAKLI